MTVMMIELGSQATVEDIAEVWCEDNGLTSLQYIDENCAKVPRRAK